MYSYTVKVYHIPNNVSAQRLETIFSRYGSCRLNLRHPRLDEDQHAFVSYTSMKEAQAAARALTGAILHGERITANVERQPGNPFNEHTVKVENLSGVTSEEKLDDLFGFNGDTEVVGIKITNPATGAIYAYIYYSNGEDAQRAVTEIDKTTIDGSVVKVKINPLKDKLQVNCEPLIVRMILSHDRPEYRSQFESIEHANLVNIKPMKNEQGFKLHGNKEGLEQVKLHLELIIDKVKERLGKKSFTLPYDIVSCFDSQKAKALMNEISKLERRHCVEFLTFDRTTEQFVSIPGPEFVKNLSAQSMGQEAETDSWKSTTSQKVSDTKSPAQLDMQVYGLEENLETAVADLRQVYKEAM